MTVYEAFQLIENLDYPEGLRRKLAPAYSLFQISRNGEVVGVQGFKELPTEADRLAGLKNNRGCIQLHGSPGMYASVEELKQHIEDSKWLFDKMNPALD